MLKNKSFLVKLLTLICVICCSFALMLGVTGCADGKDGRGIESVTINDAGELIITYTDGTNANLGVVVGEDGADGEDGAAGAPGTPGAAGAPGSNGSNGEDGKDGVGIKNAEINNKGELVITYTDGTVKNLGVVVGEDGEDLAGCDHDVNKDSDWNTYTVVDHVWDATEETIVPGWGIKFCKDGCGAAYYVVFDQHVMIETKTPATCTEPGTIDKVCSICGYVAETVVDPSAPATGHKMTIQSYFDDNDPTTNFCMDGGWVVYECSVCGEISTGYEQAPGKHTVEEWTVNVGESDGIAAGERGTYNVTDVANLKIVVEGTCSVCDTDTPKVYTSFNGSEWTKAVMTKESCTDAGKVNYTLAIGEQEFVFVVTEDADEHMLNGKKYNSTDVYRFDSVAAIKAEGFNTIEGQDASCADGGFTVAFFCEVCDVEELITVKVAIKHTEPTDGEEVAALSIAGDVVTLAAGGTATIDATNKNVYVKAATCTEGGERYFWCSKCNAVATEPTEKLSHNVAYNIVEGRGPDAGKWFLEAYCTRTNDNSCGYNPGRPIEVTDFEVITKAATCYEDGYTYVKYIDPVDNAEKTTERTVLSKADVKHKLNGVDVDLTKTMLVKNVDELTAKGFLCTETGTPTCDGEGFEVYFFCDECKKAATADAEKYGALATTLYTVNARIAHTAPEETAQPSNVVNAASYEVNAGAYTLYDAQAQEITIEENKIYKVAPTCYEDGVTVYYCTECDEIVYVTKAEDPALAKLSHVEKKEMKVYDAAMAAIFENGGENVIDGRTDEQKQADEEPNYVLVVSCDRQGCEYVTYTFVIATSEVIKEATCYEEGTTRWTFGDNYADVAIAKVNHTVGTTIIPEGKGTQANPWEIDDQIKSQLYFFEGDPGSCQSNTGVKAAFFCSVCSAAEIEDQPLIEVYVKTAHKAPTAKVAIYKDSNGEYFTTPTFEAASKIDSVTAQANKLYVYTPADCAAVGYTAYKCTECGTFIEKDEPVAGQHKYAFAVATKPSDVAGTIKVTCENCPAVNATVTLPAINPNALTDNADDRTKKDWAKKDGNYLVNIDQVATCQKVAKYTYCYETMDRTYGMIKVTFTIETPAVDHNLTGEAKTVQISNGEKTWIVDVKYCDGCNTWIEQAGTRVEVVQYNAVNAAANYEWATNGEDLVVTEWITVDASGKEVKHTAYTNVKAGSQTVGCLVENAPAEIPTEPQGPQGPGQQPGPGGQQPGPGGQGGFPGGFPGGI